MKFASLVSFAALAAATDHGSTYGGTGPFKSYYFEVESLPNHTFYQPLQSALNHPGPQLKLPVIVWGNGACDAWGLKFRAFLGEVTSYGALAIATGPTFVDPSTYTDVNDPPTDNGTLAAANPGALTKAVDWVHENAGKGEWKHIDASRIGVWGQSCGGIEAYMAAPDDDRVGHIGIFNSGEFTTEDSKAVAGSIQKPIFYVLGGPTDIAYENGERDYSCLPESTPAWKGNHDLGHSAAFDEPNAGIPGITGRYIMEWLLRGQTHAKKWFVGDGPKDIGFVDVVYQNLDNIHVTPIH